MGFITEVEMGVDHVFMHSENGCLYSCDQCDRQFVMVQRHEEYGELRPGPAACPWCGAQREGGRP